jgi:hypothetical protein
MDKAEGHPPLDYYHERARIERAAAEAAECPQAKAAHFELAERYEQIVCKGGEPAPETPAHTPDNPLIVISNG